MHYFPEQYDEPELPRLYADSARFTDRDDGLTAVELITDIFYARAVRGRWLPPSDENE